MHIESLPPFASLHPLFSSKVLSFASFLFLISQSFKSMMAKYLLILHRVLLRLLFPLILDPFQVFQLMAQKY